MRLKYINIKKQNSFKKRYIKRQKNTYLRFGNIGLVSFSNFRFEFIYFRFLKKWFKSTNSIRYNKFNKQKLWLLLSLNYPITKKSKNSRMGKGKGGFLRWAFLVFKKSIIIEFYGLNLFRLKKIVKAWNFTLSKKVYLEKKKFI